MPRSSKPVRKQAGQCSQTDREGTTMQTYDNTDAAMGYAVRHIRATSLEDLQRQLDEAYRAEMGEDLKDEGVQRALSMHPNQQAAFDRLQDEDFRSEHRNAPAFDLNRGTTFAEFVSMGREAKRRWFYEVEKRMQLEP